MKKVQPIFFTALILILLACSNHADHPENKKLTDIPENYQNRSTQKKLTAVKIDSTPDENLIQLITDHLTDKLPEEYEKEYDAVLSWNKAQQAIYMIRILETEINLGGFRRFFENSSEQFYQHLPDAFLRIGATKYSELMFQANQTYEKENEKISEAEYGSGETSGETHTYNPYKKVDIEFIALNESNQLQEIQIAFIRSHKNDFADE